MPANVQTLEKAIRRSARSSQGELSLEQYCDLFKEIEDLTFVFIMQTESDRGCYAEYGPDYLTALVLASSVSREVDFRRPFDKEEDKGNDATVREYRQRIRQLVAACVRELRLPHDMTFVLLWNVAGSPETHSVTSNDLEWDGVLFELLALFSDRLNVYIPY